MKILYKPNNINYTVPTRGTNGAAGWDLYAAEDVILEAFKPALIATELDVEIPKGTMLLVLPRGGNSLKRNFIIPNSPGLVDEDYRGHLQVILTYLPGINGALTTKINYGDRIAQAVLVKYEEQEWEKSDEVSTTERGSGGFGSTGT